MNLRNLLPRALAIGVACIAGPVSAACAISNAPLSIAFGAYTPITFPGRIASAHVDSNATVTVSCSGLAQPVNYVLKLSAGASNSIESRTMTRAGGGGPGLAYNLYVDASRATPWGDGIQGATFNGTVGPTDGPVNHVFYGRIPARQTSAMPGSYSDQLVVTIEYGP